MSFASLSQLLTEDKKPEDTIKALSHLDDDDDIDFGNDFEDQPQQNETSFSLRMDKKHSTRSESV